MRNDRALSAVATEDGQMSDTTMLEGHDDAAGEDEDDGDDDGGRGNGRRR